MTAIAARRKRRTWYAFAAGLLVVAAIPVLGIAGWRAIRDSRAGRDVTSRPAAVPITPTGLLAGVDDDGQLATLAMLTLAPGGAGGSVVSIPVGSSVMGEDGLRRRLADGFADGGLDQLRTDVESLLLVTIDVAGEADGQQLAALLAPVGPVAVDLPAEVRDGGPPPPPTTEPPSASSGDDTGDSNGGTGGSTGDAGEPGDDPDSGSGATASATTSTTAADPGADEGDVDVAGSEVVAPAGSQTLEADALAGVLLASVSGESEVDRLPANLAVWQGIAAAVGAGRPGLTGGEPGVAPPDIATFTSELWAGSVGVWQMRVTPITSPIDNPSGADLLQTDLAEAIMVVATVAPSAVSAVLDGASVQLTSGFEDWTVTRNAVALLAYIGANVMIVITSPDAPPAQTEVLSGTGSVRAVAEDYAKALEAGPVGTITDPIEGIAVQIVLGQSFADAQTDGGAYVPLESVPSQDTVDANLMPSSTTGEADGTGDADGTGASGPTSGTGSGG